MLSPLPSLLLSSILLHSLCQNLSSKTRTLGTNTLDASEGGNSYHLLKFYLSPIPLQSVQLFPIHTEDFNAFLRSPISNSYPCVITKSCWTKPSLAAPSFFVLSNHLGVIYYLALGTVNVKSIVVFNDE